MQKRLLYLTDAEWESNSSLSIIARRFVTGLRRKGWEVRLFAPSTMNREVENEEISWRASIRQFRLIHRLQWNLKKSLSPFSLNWWWVASAKPLLLQEALSFQPAGIVAQGFLSSYLAYQCFQKLKVPYVIDQRDAWTVNPYLLAFPLRKRWKKQLKNWIWRRMEWKILQNARYIFFLAEQLREPYLRTFHLPPEKTAILYNAWNPDERMPGRIFQRPDTLHFLFGGSLPLNAWKSLKNFLLTLQSLPEVAEKTHISFYISGWAKEAQKFIQRLPLTCSISFSPALTLQEYHQRVEEADICLTFRSSNPFDYGCNRIFSYMLYRKPILSIVHPHSTEGQLVAITGLGWVVHPEDTERMKQILLEIQEKKKNEPLVKPDEEEIRKLSLPVQVNKLSHILESILIS